MQNMRARCLQDDLSWKLRNHFAAVADSLNKLKPAYHLRALHDALTQTAPRNTPVIRPATKRDLGGVVGLIEADIV